MWPTPGFSGTILFSPGGRAPIGSRRPSHRRAARPRLEALEGRALLAILTVTSPADSGDGTLRAAIAAASPGDTIDFKQTIHTITLTQGQLNITQDLDIEGPGANKLTISGNDSSRVFNISAGETVTIAGLTIADGRAQGVVAGVAPAYASEGGGVLNLGDLTLSNDVLSNNEALGLTNVVGAGLFSGGARGGGVNNHGTLIVDSCEFRNNLAQGADHSSGTNVAGFGGGGAISNGPEKGTSASITGSLFVGNVAQGGTGGGSNTFVEAGLGFGGAIVNGSALEVTDSTFVANQALGGNNNIGSRITGAGLGGAIGSGISVSTQSVAVSGSTFVHNQAVGGNGNTVTSGVVLRGPNMAFGGAILIGGDLATITDSMFRHNQALGGQGADNSNGGIGFGGGIGVFAILSRPTSITVTGGSVDHNAAIGGPGGPGGIGGLGLGGGLATALAATLTVESTTVDHNKAQGGDGGGGGDGGNGLGGGIYEDAASSLDLIGVPIQYNFATGGSGGPKGSDGQGIGGGVYLLGTFSMDPTTDITKNHASTSSDDQYP